MKTYITRDEAQAIHKKGGTFWAELECPGIMTSGRVLPKDVKSIDELESILTNAFGKGEIKYFIKEG